MRKSVEDVFATYQNTLKRRNSSTLDYYDSVESPSISPQKIQGSFNKNLLKQKSHIQSNIYKYRQKSFQSKPTQVTTQDQYQSRKSSFSLAEQLLMMDSVEKGYNLFKNVNNVAIQRSARLKLKPISKTIEVRKGMQQDKQKQGKTMAQRIQQLKQRKLRVRNQKLDCNVIQNGKLTPLRLALSNKVRNKIVKDLLSNSDQTKNNIQKILQRQNQHQWLNQFSDLKRSLDLNNQQKKRRHHKQLISRSTYNNVYYQFLALDSVQKKQYLKKSSRKMMREEYNDANQQSEKVKQNKQQKQQNNVHLSIDENQDPELSFDESNSVEIQKNDR